MERRGKSNKDSVDERSLCEKSMKVVSNIIRISSFSLAQKTLGTTVKVSKKEENEDMVAEVERLNRFSGSSRMLQEPMNRPNRTYVIKPRGWTNEEEVDEISHHRRCVVHQHEIEKKEECVDGLASDYIKKIRNQMGCGL